MGPRLLPVYLQQRPADVAGAVFFVEVVDDQRLVVADHRGPGVAEVVAAAILALAEDNVKLREAYASCGRSRAGLEEALKKERAK